MLGVLATSPTPEKSVKCNHLAKQFVAALIDVLRREAGERMWHHDEAEIRNAPQLGHFAGGGVEGVGDYSDRGNAGSFEDDRIEQAARRAGAAIADTGDNEIRLTLQFGDLGIFDRRPLRLVDDGCHSHAVSRVELLGKLAKHLLGVLLGVLDEADAQAAQTCGARNKINRLLLGRHRGIEKVHPGEFVHG
jgi:hypothetical protein